jgi:sugar (pentulose or hexulose) kinase
MGSPVKASRLFAGHQHDTQVERIAQHFNQKVERYHSLSWDNEAMQNIINRSQESRQTNAKSVLNELPFATRELSGFKDDKDAYYHLMYDLVVQQYASTQLVLKGTQVKRIYVDGGFSNNAIYMNLLAAFFPEMEIYASSIPQATAIGAALAIHLAWNGEAFPEHIIELRRFTSKTS